MRSILIFALVLIGVGQTAASPATIPWEPAPTGRVIKPLTEEEPGESSVVGSVIDISIAIYRFTLSDIQGEICAFYPSCSHYAEQAIDSCGAIIGILMIADRLERCNWVAWSYADRYYPVCSTNDRLKLGDPVSANCPKSEGKR